MRRDIVLKETVLRRWFYNAVDRKNEQCRLLYRAVLSKESITCTNLKFFREEPAGSFFFFNDIYVYMSTSLVFTIFCLPFSHFSVFLIYKSL